ALAGEEHRALVLADGVDQAVDRLHAGALADQLAEALQAADLAAQARVLALERREAQDALEREQDLLRPRVLDQVVGGAELHRLDRRLDRAVAGEHERRRRDPAPAPPRSCRARSSSMRSMTGILRSVSTTSKVTLPSRASAASPCGACSTSYPARSRFFARRRAMVSSSST